MSNKNISSGLPHIGYQDPKQLKTLMTKMKVVKNEIKEIHYGGQVYYKKKVVNSKTQRLNSLLVCGG